MTKNVHDPAQSKIINMNHVQNTLGKGTHAYKQVRTVPVRKGRENA